MGSLKVSVIGHVVSGPSVINLPKNPRSISAQLSAFNYTKVVTEDGLLMEHHAWLKRDKGLPEDSPLSVWEMYGCAGLLLSSYLRGHGHRVQLINHITNENEDRQLSEIEAFSPSVIVVSTTFVLSRMHLVSIGKKLKKRFPNAFIVAGGHHVAASLLHMDVPQKKDYIVNTGFDGLLEDFQGEAGLLSLVESFPGGLGQVPNLVWIRPDGEVIVNDRVVETNDINATLINFDDVPPGSVVHIRTARSCSFKCAFCSYPSVAGPLSLMDFDHVKQTIRKAKAAQVSALFFVDDTFNVPAERFEALLDWMIDEGPIPWYSFLRCQYVNEKIVEKMRLSGCVGVFLGIESGSDEILKNMKKGAVSGFYRDGIRWLKEAGIITVGAFIIGFPGETDETVAATYDIIENYGLDFYFLQPFYYLNHTPIFKRAEEFGLSGKGMFWAHNTMNSTQAMDHIHRLFKQVKNSVFINPDYTLWEVAYLKSKGFSFDDILEYRRKVNDLTVAQMQAYLS